MFPTSDAGHCLVSEGSQQNIASFCIARSSSVTLQIKISGTAFGASRCASLSTLEVVFALCTLNLPLPNGLHNGKVVCVFFLM